MRAIVVILLIALGTAALLYQTFASRIRHTQDTVERFRQMPVWSPFRIMSAPRGVHISDFSEHATDYSRYV